MKSSGTVTVRLDRELSERVEPILAGLGLSAADAIRLFFTQVEIHRGLPFDMPPSETTRRALDDARARRGLTRCGGIDELFRDLDR